MAVCPILQAFADALGSHVSLVNTDDAPQRRARAYALVEAALHENGPAACDLAGLPVWAQRLRDTPLVPGEPSGGNDRPGNSHVAWEALGEAEYRVRVSPNPPDWSAGEQTTSSGRTHGETEVERWSQWARRASTWALRANMATEATALLTDLAGGA